MNKAFSEIKKAILTTLILVFTVLITFSIHTLELSVSLIPMLFVLAVFVISLITREFLWGIIASLFSVLVVNYAFTYPYYQFNFSISDNLFSAFVMLAVAITTGITTVRINHLEKMKAESEKEKLRANLLRAISHDLRTPLTTIYGSSSAIIENYDNLNKERQITLLKDIKEDSESMIRLVENLLSVTKINAENVKINMTPTVLWELMDSVLVKFKKNYPNQNVKLIIPDEFVSIPMDTVLITQVLLNLMENAVLHAKGMTELILKTELTEDGFAEISVCDDGCGIAKNKLSAIFSGYSESNSSPADGGRNNLGIGLSVCSTIIKAHGSEVKVESSENGGTVFSFSLKTEENNLEEY